MKDSEITTDLAIRPSSTLLWIAILASPLAFAIQFESRYALVQWACFSHRGWVLAVISITSLLAAAGAALLGWVSFARLDPSVQRARFMALAALILGVGFSLAILASGVPHMFLGACD